MLALGVRFSVAEDLVSGDADRSVTDLIDDASERIGPGSEEPTVRPSMDGTRYHRDAERLHAGSLPNLPSSYRHTSDPRS